MKMMTKLTNNLFLDLKLIHMNVLTKKKKMT